MLIEYFGIKKLFGYQDFEITFFDKDTIFVGENGMGKTTILSILYHTISLNFSEILEYEFESIEIKYKNSTKFCIKQSDIELFDKRNQNNHRRFSEELIKQVEEVIDENKIEISDAEECISMVSRELRKKGIRVSFNYIREALSYSYQNNSDELKDFISETKELLKSVKILYFPTYRRIEEDIYNIKNEDRIIYDDNDLHYIESPRRRKKYTNVGELIQFGMNDVQRTLDELLDTIKKSSIDSFNKMTGELLHQYVSNDIDINEQKTKLTKEEILISLSRVGTEIKSDLQNQIIELFNKGTLNDNKYLMNFIVNLVEKNHNLEYIDNKIQIFVDICNRYLYGKKFVYDPSAVKLEIQSLNHPGVIPLSKLSSGEKQIISTFSKIYLKNDEQLIILFDEPELSLSIDWQKKFIYDVTKAENCKFSISVTHSAYIFSDMIESATELKKYLKVMDKYGNS
ncbi:AAA family ATPase [Enterococcus faecalis]|uniref:AAA family ATPase n=2 Tax=Enterococcus TaxID=1350 RepID=UPI003D1FEC36